MCAARECGTVDSPLTVNNTRTSRSIITIICLATNSITVTGIFTIIVGTRQTPSPELTFA